ncbi:MAG: formylglycine-generating enzyme family protein [Enhygromyxa sp.]
MSVPVGHLVIVEDGALSMAPFRRQVRSLVAAARRGERFARVDAIAVDMSNPERLEAEQPWSQVASGSPLIVLVIQDGRAPACRGGALRRWLDQVPQHGVVAWLHPWEQRFWTRTPVIRLRVGRPPPQGDGLPLLPLTGPGLEALIPWVQGRGPGALLGVELPRERPRLQPQRTQPSAKQIAAAFHHRAHPLSQAAVGLAAGVPGGKVDVDLLRMLGAELAQGRVTSTHLAEAMTSGLFRRGGEGESTVIEFVSDEALEQAVRWLPYGDLTSILESLIPYVESGRNRDPALHFDVDLLISLRDGTAPPEGLELARGVPGKLRAWVKATGFPVHPKLEELLKPRGQALDVIELLGASRAQVTALLGTQPECTPAKVPDHGQGERCIWARPAVDALFFGDRLRRAEIVTPGVEFSVASGARFGLTSEPVFHNESVIRWCVRGYEISMFPNGSGTVSMLYLVELVASAPTRWVEQIINEKSGIELVRIPAGSFLMGSTDDDKQGYDDERPQHEVELAAFYLARTPVTNAQYARYLAAHPDAPKPEYWDDQDFNQTEQPVVGVSWDQAMAYCEWAGLVLPTEAQWEYACRAGTTTQYWSGDKESDLALVGWYDGNSDGRLHAVGEKEANPFGLYDMHGNVWEWCRDGWVDNYKTAPRAGDGLRHEPVAEGYRVIRGGSWGDAARGARSAFRDGSRPGGRGLFLGFRPAQVIP